MKILIKKTIFIGISVLAVAVVVAVNVNFSSKSNSLSNLTLANVEALADGEGTNVLTCYSTYRITLKNENRPEPVWAIINCGTCLQVACYEYKDSGTCTKGNIILV